MFIWYDWLYIILGLIVLPGIIFGVWAQSRVHSTYLEANKMFSQKGVATQDMARRVLDAAGLTDVQIKRVPGELTDHYNLRTKTVAISEKNWNNTSLASLGIVAHEIGHALQHKKKYAPLRIQQFAGTVSNFISRWLIVLLIFSAVADVVLMSYSLTNNLYVLYGMLGIYGLSTITTLLTLPVEYNASSRTHQILVTTGLLDEEEFVEVKKVLNAAALTYVAAAVISILMLLRIVAWVLLRTRRR